MKKPPGFIAKSALLLALPFLCGGCRAGVRALQSSVNAPSDSAAGSLGRSEPPLGAVPPGVASAPIFVPASQAITSGGVPLEKIALPKASAQQNAQIAAATLRADAWAKKMRADFFPDAASGFGLIIGEPVVQGASTRGVPNGFNAANFGAGCARWIFLQVGGRGELGKTPLWGSVDDARQGLGLRDLKLGAAQAAQIAASLGVTHVAVGTFSGDEKNASLSYRLLKMPEKTPVGAPLVVRGNAAQIAAQLPQLAAQLATRLNAKPDGIAVKVNVGAAELSFLGSVPWKATKVLGATETEKLRVLAAREPLAALLYLRDGDTIWGDPRRRAAMKIALQNVPDNAMLLADLMRAAPDELRSEYSRIDAGLKKYPANALFNTGDWYRWQSLADLKKQRVAAESLISCAPDNPMSWATLADTMGNIAQELRRSRFHRELAPREAGFLDRLYEMRLQCSLHAAKLSSSAPAWNDIAIAATFADEPDIADAALWKSLAGNRRLLGAYRWGCQMYQAKWGGDANRGILLVKMIYADPVLMRSLWSEAGDLLRGIGMENEAETQRLFAISQVAAQLKKNPNDAKSHRAWAYLERDMAGRDANRDAVSMREFKAAIALCPNDPVPLHHLGEMLHFKQRQYRQTEKLYRRALALNPDYPDTLKTLGNLTYYVHRDAAGAEKLYRRAIALNSDLFNDGYFRAELARLLLDTGRRDEAVKETMRAIESGYHDRNNEIFARLNLDPDAEFQAFLARRDQKLYQF
ncbi:MAG: tetratricopeptide repeat protein [Acidimicrobiales bacterium]